MARRSADGRLAAIAAALGPYVWRGLTDRMLARRVVGALDRHSVVGFLTGLPGAEVGAAGPVEPAQPGDERVDAGWHSTGCAPTWWRRWTRGRSSGRRSTATSGGCWRSTSPSRR